MESTGRASQESAGLPSPNFSKSNPYWFDPRIEGVYPAYQRRLTGHDFLAAAMWERTCSDVHGAFCVREATILSLRIQGGWKMRQQIKELLGDERRNGKNNKAKPHQEDASNSNDGRVESNA